MRPLSALSLPLSTAAPMIKFFLFQNRKNPTLWTDSLGFQQVPSFIHIWHLFAASNRGITYYSELCSNVSLGTVFLS